MITNFMKNNILDHPQTPPIASAPPVKKTAPPRKVIPLGVQSFSESFKAPYKALHVTLPQSTFTKRGDNIVNWREQGWIKPINASKKAVDNIFSTKKIIYTIPQKYFNSCKKYIESDGKSQYRPGHGISIKYLANSMSETLTLDEKGQERLKILNETQQHNLSKKLVQNNVISKHGDIGTNYFEIQNQRFEKLKSNEDVLPTEEQCKTLLYMLNDLNGVIAALDSLDLNETPQFKSLSTLAGSMKTEYLALAGVQHVPPLPTPLSFDTQSSEEIAALCQRKVLIGKDDSFIFYKRPEKKLNPDYLEQLKVLIDQPKYTMSPKGVVLTDHYGLSLEYISNLLRELSKYNYVDIQDVNELEKLQSQIKSSIEQALVKQGMLITNLDESQIEELNKVVERITLNQTIDSDQKKLEDLKKEPDYKINPNYCEQIKNEIMLIKQDKSLDLKQQVEGIQKLVVDLFNGINFLTFLSYGPNEAIDSMAKNYEIFNRMLLEVSTKYKGQFLKEDEPFVLPPMERMTDSKDSGKKEAVSDSPEKIPEKFQGIAKKLF